MCMQFLKFHIRFVDYLHFSWAIETPEFDLQLWHTLKGFFPHFFTAPEHQDYIGKVPPEDMHGVMDMGADTYSEKVWALVQK